MDARVKTGEELEKRKPLYLFGRDVTTIPCFRNSFIFGMCSGVVAGLACFLFTSKARLSTHVSFGSMWVCVFGYWIPCRYKYETFQLQCEAAKQSRREKLRSE